MALQDLLLERLEANGAIEDTSDLLADQNEISGILRSLESKEMIIFQQKERERWNLTAEAQNTVDNGSPEATLYEAVVNSMDGLKISDIPVRCYRERLPQYS